MSDKNHANNQIKRLSIALDNLEEGTDEQEIERLKSGKLIAPNVPKRDLYRDVIRIAWPSLIELLLTQLVSMVDLMMVGRLGAAALSAVGLTTQPKFLLMTLFMSLNVGTTAMVARYKGANMRDMANKVLRQSLILSGISTLIMSALGFIFAHDLVLFMGGQADTIANATTYLKIQMVGFTFLGLTSTVTAALRGAGDSKTAMIYNVTANVVNVILNYMLIYGNFFFPRLEVAGASLATIIGQFVAFLMAFRVIFRKSEIDYLGISLKDDYKIDFKIIKEVAAIGIPAMVEQLFMRAGIMIFSKTVAGLGTIAYATHQVCMNIQALSFMMGQAFAVSATSLVGQSLGKKRSDMAKAYSGYTCRVGLLGSLILMAIFILFSRQIVMMYTDETEVINAGASILLYVAFLQPFQGIQFIMAGALRGAGDTKYVAIMTFITVLILRASLGVIFVDYLNLGLNGAWAALAIDQLMRTLLVSMRYKGIKWMYKSRYLHA